MTGVQTCALRSEEHTSELQSHDNLVCRLLLEKKKTLSTPWHLNPTGQARGTVAAAAAVHPRPSGAGGGRRRRGCGGGAGLGCHFFFFNDPAPPEISPLSLPAPLRF